MSRTVREESAHPEDELVHRILRSLNLSNANQAPTVNVIIQNIHGSQYSYDQSQRGIVGHTVAAASAQVADTRRDIDERMFIIKDTAQLATALSSTSDSMTSQTTHHTVHQCQGDGSPTAPLCPHGYEVILMSYDKHDNGYLEQLTSKIHANTNCKAHFILCSDDFNPELIQKKLSDMSVCEDVVTMVIFTYRWAADTLYKALSENSLRKFFKMQGTFGEEIDRKIENIRKNLAVFTFFPLTEIEWNSAKIAFNIHLTHDPAVTTGEVRTFGANDKKTKTIYFALEGKWTGDVSEFISNTNVIRFIQKTLLIDHCLQCCSQD